MYMLLVGYLTHSRSLGNESCFYYEKLSFSRTTHASSFLIVRALYWTICPVAWLPGSSGPNLKLSCTSSINPTVSVGASSLLSTGLSFLVY